MIPKNSKKKDLDTVVCNDTSTLQPLGNHTPKPQPLNNDKPTPQLQPEILKWLNITINKKK